MTRPTYTHAAQRSSRLWHGDDLFRLVERVPSPLPELIPVGQAVELALPILTETPETDDAAD